MQLATYVRRMKDNKPATHKPIAPDRILPDVAAHLGIDNSTIRYLRHSQNFVYEFTTIDGSLRILRITSDSHRKLPAIEQELRWIKYLHNSSVHVCRPLEYNDGSFVYSISTNEDLFHCVVFEKASGRPLTKTDLGPELYYLHGKYLGRIHRASKKYPQERLKERGKWDEERYFTTDIEDHLAKSAQGPIKEAVAEFQSKLNSISMTVETFGPVHMDLGYSNFYLNQNRLDIFDFDNCMNGYFVSDIAAALYSSVFNVLRCEFKGDRSVFESPKTEKNLEEVWKPFCEGYQSENRWVKDWNEQLDLCIRIMYLRSFVHAYRMQYPVKDSYTKRLLEADIENIIQRKVPIHFDFHEGKAMTLNR